MTFRTTFAGSLLVLAAIGLSGSAFAGYKLMASGKSVAVAKSGLTVTPSTAWNKLGARPGRNAESWTIDGLSLNDMTFYGGIANDQTLFREVDKKNKPLPRFSSTMLLPDIASLFESSYRIAAGTSLFSVDSIEPAKFSGSDGFSFSYSFTVQDEEVARKGLARGAIIGGKLYMVTYEAPKIHYFDRYDEAFTAIANSASVKAKK
jgi:hypothetical protein